MSDDVKDLVDAGYKPVLVGPQPFSLEDLLRHIDPGPDEETDRFVEAIYSERRESASNFRPSERFSINYCIHDDC